MARIALIKLFTGLNLGVSQLSGELQRAGHDTIIVYFKDYLMVPRAEVAHYRVTDSMQCVGFGAMVSFPKFGYTEHVAQRNAKLTVSDADYDYYHKLYYLTRTPLPRWLVRRLGKSRILRRWPSLIDPLLPKKLRFFFLGDPKDLSAEVLDAPHAQAIIPGGELDRGHRAEAAAPA